MFFLFVFFFSFFLNFGKKGKKWSRITKTTVHHALGHRWFLCELNLWDSWNKWVNVTSLWVTSLLIGRKLNVQSGSHNE